MRNSAKVPAKGQPATGRGHHELAYLLDKLPDAAYTCDAEGLITYYNERAVQLWGRAPKLNDPVDRFCGSFKLFAADGTPIRHDQCWMALALETGHDYNAQEILIERPGGERLTVLAHANPIRDGSGRVLGAVNVLVDISEVKQTVELRARLAAIVESSDDAIVSKTLEGIILSWNRGAERLFGFAAAEAVGQSINLIIPPDRLDEEKSILQRLRNGERIDHFETVRRAKDGRLIDISLTTSPVRDASGRVVGASKVARDISSRKQGEAELLALKDQLAAQLSDLRRLHEMGVRLSTTLEMQPILEETLRTAAAFESSEMGVLLICDVANGQLEVGASLGFSQESLKLIENVPPGGGACGTCFQQRRRIVVEDTEIDPLFADYRAEARRAGFRAVHSTPLLTRDGRVVGVLSTHFRRPHRPSDRVVHLIDLCARHAVDFIENARLYAQLREADRRKDEFLATLAHELRNPLAPIRNALQVLQNGGRTAESVDWALGIISRQTQQMTRLIDDLMDVSRISRNKLDLRKQRITLAEVVRAAVETSRPLIEAAGHEFSVTLPPEPIYLEADPTRLAQALANLLNNSARYTDRGGRIWLAAERQGSDAVLSVRDTGIGIPAEMLPRIFEMFTQTERAKQRGQGGLGIGLSLVQRLVAMHGGSVQARSDGPGKGSEFTVRLPILLNVDTADNPDADTDVPSSPARSLRVLVADDSRDSAATMCMLLRILGHDVRAAYDGLEAVGEASEYRPDVVLLDIGMPRMNGYEAARKIRSESWGRNVVLIALTGWGQERDKARSLEVGFDHHFVKPVDPKVLTRLLESIARTAALRDERLRPVNAT